MKTLVVFLFSDQPERTALVFLGGVCVGLLVTLCAIVFQIHCRADCHYGNSNRPKKRHRSRHPQRLPGCPHHRPIDSNPNNTAVVTCGRTGPTGDSDSEDWDETSELSARRRRRFERALLNATMFTSAEGISHTRNIFTRIYKYKCKKFKIIYYILKWLYMVFRKKVLSCGSCGAQPESFQKVSNVIVMWHFHFVFLELDRAQRLEERERILREIWMNGQPDISTVTQSLNRYY